MEPVVPRFTKRKEGKVWQVLENGVHLIADGLSEAGALKLIRTKNKIALNKSTPLPKPMSVRG